MVTNDAACPRCGQPSSLGKRFCADCGARLPVACPACGAEQPSAMPYCVDCGVSMPGWCASCGREGIPGKPYCGFCGAAMQAAAPAGTVSRSRPSPAAPAAEPRAIEERRLVTALFCDLVGFTPLSESLDAEEVRTLQTAYFERMSGIIARFGGTVEKFAGDAVLALFGVPVAHGDDAERAVLCAIEMQDAIGSLAADSRRRWGHDLALRIGVNTGEGVSGVVDAGGRRDLSVTGDVVNTAARLQTAAEPGSIMVGEETMRLARRAVRFGDRRELTLKGKSSPVAAYQVLEVRQGASRRTSEGRMTPLVGREHEIAVLQAAWNRARSGEGALISIVADAGIGKSRLMIEAVTRFVEGAAVCWGRCLSYGQDIALSLIADVLRSIIGVREHMDVAGVQRRLAETVEAWLADEDAATRAEALDVLGEVLGLGPASSGVSRADAQARRQVLVRSLRALLAGATRTGPVVVVLDDLHWIDAASAEVLRDLLADVPGFPILVTAAFRPGWTPPWADWSWTERLNVRPLGERDAVALARDALGGEDLDSALERYVVERSAGNPFFVEELVHALEDAGGVVRQSGVVHLVEAAADRLPTTLTEIVLARLDSLETDVRDLVQVASVIGRNFAVDLLRLVTRRSDAAIDHGLSALLHADIAFPRQGAPSQYAFKHVTMRDVAYNTLLLRRRQELHASIARIISALEPTDESVEIVAYHFSQTDEHAEAAVWLERAGDRSAAMFANQSAIGHYEEARRRYRLSDAPADVVARVSEKLGRVFGIISWFDEALEELALAAELYRDRGDLDAEAGAVAEISRVHYTRGASEEAIACVQDVLERLEWDDDETPAQALAQVYIAMVDPLYGLNRFEDALTAAWRAVEAARARNDDRLLMEATVRYGLALRGIGRLNEAAAVLSEVIPAAEMAGDPTGLAKALVWSGDIALAQGKPREAQQLYERAIRVDQNRGDLAETASLLLHLGQVAVILGDWAEARSRFERAVELVRSISFSHVSTTALITLGEHYLLEGAHDQAERYLEEPFTIAERSGQTAQIPYLQIPLAARDLFEGRPGAALARLEPLLEQPRFETSLDHRGLQIAAGAHVETGNLEAARSLADRGLDHARGQTNLLAVLGWLQVYAALAARAGDREGAERNLLEALSVAEEIGYRHQEARIRQSLGELHGAAEEPGRRELARALEIFRALGAWPEAERVEQPAALDYTGNPL
jgi:adenylate cyclase